MLKTNWYSSTLTCKMLLPRSTDTVQPFDWEAGSDIGTSAVTDGQFKRSAKNQFRNNFGKEGKASLEACFSQGIRFGECVYYIFFLPEILHRARE